MDFLIEVIIGLLDGTFRDEKEYIIDIEKYPRAFVYFVTILYSVFLLAVIGLLFIAGYSGMNEYDFFEGLACMIIAIALSLISIRKVVRTIRHIKEKNVSENSSNNTNQEDLLRFYREEWKLRKQYAKKLKIKRILFLIFTGVIFAGAIVGSMVLRNSIIRASQNKGWPETIVNFLHSFSNEKDEQPEVPMELIKSANSDYEITYLKDIRYANEPAEVNPQLISYIDEDSRTLYIRLKPGGYNVVPFITVTVYDKYGNKLTNAKGSYDGGADIWTGYDWDIIKTGDGEKEDDADKTGHVVKITHEGILPIVLNIPASETDVSYSVVCNGGTSLTPTVNTREITNIIENNRKLYVTISGGGLEKEIYVLLYKDGAFVNLLSGITEDSYIEWNTNGYTVVVFDLGELEFDTVEVYD